MFLKILVSYFNTFIRHSQKLLGNNTNIYVKQVITLILLDNKYIVLLNYILKKNERIKSYYANATHSSLTS